MRETTIMMKPASSTCNCVCTYCFYDDVSACRSVKSFGVMEASTSEKIIVEALNNQQVDKVNFVFQGGEPLVAGFNYFKHFVDTVKKEQQGKQVSFAIQTNGTLLNKQFCELFKANNFLVGISIDGYKENHDRHRFLSRNGSFASVYAGYNLLKEYEIAHNVLTVLTKNLAANPQALYSFYKEEGIKHVQIIECLPDFNQSVEESPFACTPALYDSFYTQLFHLWLDDLRQGIYMSINLFDDCIRLIHNTLPITCGRFGLCSPQTIVEADGSIYPCDFYVLDEFQQGNINTESLEAIVNPQDYEAFIKDRGAIQKPCADCKFYNKICHGGCKRMRETFINDSQCSYQKILNLFIEHRYEISRQLKKLGLI
ncbi:MAG TPA: SPASM domain-containing protein [Erysipelothrix sp.]